MHAPPALDHLRPVPGSNFFVGFRRALVLGAALWSALGATLWLIAG